MFKKKEDGRFRIEMKFKDGLINWLVSDDYQKICAWYEVIKKPIDDSFSESILEAIVYDGDKPLASWCNSKAIAA